MSVENLHDVLVDMMKDTYHAEKQLVSALPKMAKAAKSDALREAFEAHLEETREQVARLEKAFSIMEMKPAAKMCHGMKGLIDEGKEVIEEGSEESPASSDAALIAAAQKVEHYEISAYGTMAAYANALGLQEVASIFSQTLEEEKATDVSLTELAQASIESAMHEGEQGEEGGEQTEKAEKSESSQRKNGRGSSNGASSNGSSNGSANGSTGSKASKSKATRHKASGSAA